MSIDRLRTFLLPKTIAYAAHNAPFYQRHWENAAWEGVQTLDDLALLPPVDKQKAVAEQEDMRVGVAPLDFGAISSGTTRVGKELFRVEHSEDERLALEDFYERGQAQQQADSPAVPTDGDDDGDEACGWSDEEPLVLHIITPNHGLPAGAAPENTLRLAWSYSHNVNQMIVDALARDYGGRRITVIRVSVSILKQLTAYFLENDVDFGRFAIEGIGTNAALVTRRWRAVVESLWNATIYDNYSISEVLTPATECPDCGFCHFGDPPMIPEVRSLKDGASVAEGIGELLLTTLYPFVQRQPLIRYRTGDIVEVGPRCAAIDDIGIRFVGRVHQTLLSGDKSEVLLAPAVVEDCVDDHPWVSRHTHPFELTQKVTAGTVGLPRYRIRADGTALVVEVGVPFAPRLFPDRIGTLTAALRGQILAAHPALVRAVEAGEHTLNVNLVAARESDWDEWFVKYLM